MLEKNILKLKLLSTGLFIDNQYLYDYIELVTNNTIIAGYIEKHHILQRCYYKANNLELDNSADNIVNLNYKGHCKAH